MERGEGDEFCTSLPSRQRKKNQNCSMKMVGLFGRRASCAFQLKEREKAVTIRCPQGNEPGSCALGCRGRMREGSRSSSSSSSSKSCSLVFRPVIHTHVPRDENGHCRRISSYLFGRRRGLDREIDQRRIGRQATVFNRASPCCASLPSSVSRSCARRLDFATGSTMIVLARNVLREG